jgi:hypothetical protein
MLTLEASAGPARSAKDVSSNQAQLIEKWNEFEFIYIYRKDFQPKDSQSVFQLD